LQLDDASADALTRAPADAIFIGVIDWSAGIVRLFVSGPCTNPFDRCFASHRDLVRTGVVHLEDTFGFSINIVAGEVQAFYRTSVLNRSKRDFAISHDMMRMALAALNVPLADGFRSYP
jgi:hypothetical protein